MQVDLEGQQAQVADLPRFQRAAFHAARLQRWGSGLLGLAVMGLVSAVFVDLFAALTLWPVLLVNLSCALLVVVAGLQSACGVSRWREEAMAPSAAPSQVDEVQEPPAGVFGSWVNARARRLLRQIGAPTLWLGGWALVVLYGQAQVFDLTLPATALGLGASVFAVLALLLAFALLVLERQLAQEHPGEWPEAGALAQLLRVAILSLLVGALCLLFSSDTALWPVRLAVVMGLLPASFCCARCCRCSAPRVNASNPPCWPTVLSLICCAGRHSLCSACSTNCTTGLASTCGRSGPLPICAAHSCPCWRWSWRQGGC